MWNNKVIWSEGMFLRPIHFQQHVRYVESLVEGRCQPLRSYPWGFTALKLDVPMLGLGKIAVAQARGVFPDGTPFSVPADDAEIAPIDIGGDVRNMVVSLSLPVRRFNAMEIGAGGEQDKLTRYRLSEYDTPDTHTQGGGSAALQVGRLNMKLVLESDDQSDLMTMGIARIVECREDKTVVLDDAFLPPVLDCRASPALYNFVKELQGLLHHRAEALAGRITDAGRGGVSEVADFLLLQLVNRYEPLIAHLTTINTLHPEDFYALALALAGELATFTQPRKRPPAFPPYQHDDLQTSFAPVMAELRRSLSMVLEQTAIRIPLEDRKYGIRVGPIVDRTLLKNSSFVLAVQAQMPTEDLRRRFPAQVKIGPVEKIRNLVNLQLPGIQTRPLAVAPRQIPYHAGYVYFELDRAGEFWKELDNSGGFAIHVGGEFPGLQMEFWAIRG